MYHGPLEGDEEAGILLLAPCRHVRSNRFMTQYSKTHISDSPIRESRTENWRRAGLALGLSVHSKMLRLLSFVGAIKATRLRVDSSKVQ